MNKATRKTTSADKLLRTGEACALLNICEKTLYQWARRGLISRVYIGPTHVRFRRSEVERLAERWQQ